MEQGTSNISDEQQLAELCRSQDRLAQRRLYDEYAEYLALVAYRYIPVESDAKDVLMDALLNAYRNMNKFTWQGHGSLKAWLKKIVVNQCLMYLRRNNRPTLWIDNMVTEEPATDADALNRLSAKELIEMIHSLPDGYRTVFNLYVFEGMTHREIGKILGISDNTSKSQLHKAKALLQENIKQVNKYRAHE